MQPVDSITHKQTTPEILKNIRELIADDLEAIDQLIINELASDVPLIQQIANHIIKSGGKRLRPLVVILSAKAFGYQQDNEHHELAAIIEFIHTATLLHDDVVDHSSLRRGQDTANEIWGNTASVLTGDFLYSRAFQILAKRSNIPLMKVLANTTNQIAEGEVLQLMNVNNADISEDTYRDVIKRKTAKLYAAASEVGAIIAKPDKPHYHDIMAHYGLHLGMAFQMIDDLLDYTANAETMGKNIGDDLAEGKTTLPLIYAMQHGTAQQTQRIRNAIENASMENITEIIEAIQNTQACDYTLQCAKHEATQALQCLTNIPASPYRDALQQLTDFILKRNF